MSQSGFIFDVKAATFSLQLLLLLRYPQMKRPLKFMAFRESLAVIVDSEKGNILDLR